MACFLVLFCFCVWLGSCTHIAHLLPRWSRSECAGVRTATPPPFPPPHPSSPLLSAHIKKRSVDLLSSPYPSPPSLPSPAAQNGAFDEQMEAQQRGLHTPKMLAWIGGRCRFSGLLPSKRSLYYSGMIHVCLTRVYETSDALTHACACRCGGGICTASSMLTLCVTHFFFSSFF